MPYEPVDLIEVRCWDARVGAIACDPRSGFYAFEYDSAWIRSGVELAPIWMPTTQRYPFLFPTLPVETYSRLPAMAADALPDAFGNALTTAYFANEGVRAEEITALDRLAYLGSRGIGALEFRPMRGPAARKSTAIELSELVVAARSALSGEMTTEDGMTDALKHLIAVGTSAGGARAKAVVALNPETGELRSGQVPPDPGFQQWLLKLDGVSDDTGLGAPANYGRIEYAYHLMAVEAGIDMMECRLLREGGRAHFMTRRFDRADSGAKIHTQTLCAMDHLDFKQIGVHDYAELFLVVERLGLGSQTAREVFRRMTFNVAAANYDDHTKNFTFLLPPGGDWSLSPAYDVTYAHASSNRWIRQHLMAVNGKDTGITRDDVRLVGERFAVPRAREVVDQVLAAVSAWPSFAQRAGVPEETTRAIAAELLTCSKPLRA